MIPRRATLRICLAGGVTAFALLELPATASADGRLEPAETSSFLGTFEGVSYVQYDGFFVGQTSTRDYRVPYRINAPADSRLGNGTLLVEPPHPFEGAALPDLWFGRPFLYERGFVHTSVGDRTSSTNLLDDEITVDFARALAHDEVARALIGPITRRYIAGFSSSADPVKRIVASGQAEGIFDFALLITTDNADEPQMAIAAGRFSGKVITLNSEFEWPTGSNLEDRGQSPGQYRHFMVAGSPHVPDSLCPGHFSNNTTPAGWQPALRAHFLQGHAWVTNGIAPPVSTRLATTTTLGVTNIARDANGNALLVDIAGQPAPRLPFVELGEATFVTGFVGTYLPQPPRTITQLGFSSFAEYLTAFEDALVAHVQAGYMLNEDAQVLVRRASLSPPATLTGNYFARYEEFRADKHCPTANPTPTPAPSPTPTPGTSPTPTPAAQLLNISTRLKVQTGDNALIGGFIINGNESKRLLLRAIGPSLNANGNPIPGRLDDPILELRDADGALITSNDDWKDSAQRAEIQQSGIAPDDDRESAILRLFEPDLPFTAIVRGKDNATGIGLVEAYDLNPVANSKLANIGTRGFVETDDNVMIGGFIAGLQDRTSTAVVVRALGPSLTSKGVPNALQDPTLELHDQNGAILASNDNWGTDPNAREVAETGLAPTDPRESAIYSSIAPGAYTAVVRGNNRTTGVGLVEVYNIP